jgi:hypothetical protein
MLKRRLGGQLLGELVSTIRPFTCLLYTAAGIRPAYRTLLLETSQLEKYNTKHIQTKPFSATLLSAGTLPDLERQLLSYLDSSHPPSIVLQIRSNHITVNTREC